MRLRLEDLGLIDSSQFAANVDRSGAVVWCDLPRLDDEPAFATLDDGKDRGTFRVGPAEGGAGTQRDVPDSNVVEAGFATSPGAFRVLDVGPRFVLQDRNVRPTRRHRTVEPVTGTPRRAWGNLPQAYSHIGLVHAAFAAWPHRDEVL